MYDKPQTHGARRMSEALPRRHFLWNSAGGIGGIALAWMLNRQAQAESKSADTPFVRQPHFTPKAKRIVQIFCAGGVGHIDTFDYKPQLWKLHGKKLVGKGENKGFFGRPGLIMKSPYTFKKRGKCGAWVSSLLPHLAGIVDDVAFIKSMVAKSNNHTPASFQMNSGFTQNGYPSMGSWLSYGLGSMNENLPTFVVMPDARGYPAGGSINWTAGFLPASHQGVAFNTKSKEPIVDLNTPANTTAAARKQSMKVLEKMNRSFAAQNVGNSDIEARIKSYQLASKMQTSIPEAVNLNAEPEHIKRMYGLGEKATNGMARNCMMARRLLERGVRFVQVFNGGAFGSPRINWDAHENVVQNHGLMASGMDQPVAALLMDLKQRGMLEDTLFVWNTEFGRGPATQGINRPGRDHHPDAFTCFLAGAGVKKGISYGESDDVGYFTVKDMVTIYDFHATILHLLGIDHERLTFYHNGIQQRLTNVHGEVVDGILA